MEELNQLKKDLVELTEWRERQESKQLRFPIEIGSKNVIHRNLLVPTGIEITPTGLLRSPFKVIEVMINGEKYWLNVAGKY
jgi:hypothetical protein